MFNVFVDYSVDLRFCYRRESFFIFKTFGMSSKLRVSSKYLLFGAWLQFLEQTNISDVFKIDSRGDVARENKSRGQKVFTFPSCIIMSAYFHYINAEML